ncbi:hypothetical protein [Flavobacterium johnsoniae]|uniref:hypothetical protein n=1 Tax=Flavobacterium johnsoniae TaxID=986 RepID=UPI000F4E70D7|nr:hypothetical protein [Flavobacterium johnsoniae]
MSIVMPIARISFLIDAPELCLPGPGGDFGTVNHVLPFLSAGVRPAGKDSSIMAAGPAPAADWSRRILNNFCCGKG